MIKKIFILLLVLVLLTTVSFGCSGEAETETETLQEQPVTENVPETSVEDETVEEVTGSDMEDEDTISETETDDSENVEDDQSEETNGDDTGDVPDVTTEDVLPDETEEPEPEVTEPEETQPETIEFALTCISFEDGGEIPSRHSYYGGNKSPELDWTGAPEGTISFALLVEDPDGGDWSHWVVYNLGADITGLGEDQPYLADLLGGVYQGKNDFGQTGWGGPSPPSGTHRYYFRLYALDTMLDLAPGVTIDQVKAAMEGHIIDIAELMGTYSAS